jgi:23S rRNA pseudouridine1911/1915/1917 synthase
MLAPEISRSQAVRIIKAGLVTINGATARSSSIVRPGDHIEIAAPPPSDTDVHPRAAPEIEVLAADDELIVVNKPAGMAVHQAPGHTHSTLVDALMARFPELARMVEPDGFIRPGIVHRLDKDTSGVMVIARTPFARTGLARQFKDRTVRKFYLAIVEGVVRRDSITIDRPLGRHPVDRKKISVRSRTPREAISHVTVLHRFADATLVGVRPETGRTHQIRVHLAAIGHQCIADQIYGRGERQDFAPLHRQALHAYAIEIEHPRRAERLLFGAPIAEDMRLWISRRASTSIEQKIKKWLHSEQHAASAAGQS